MNCPFLIVFLACYETTNRRLTEAKAAIAELAMLLKLMKQYRMIGMLIISIFLAFRYLDGRLWFPVQLSKKV